MGVQKIIETTDFKIGIYAIKEDDLIDEKNSLTLKNCNYKNKKRRNEWLSIRLLLKAMNESSDISYDKFGAPNIKENKISISHSSNLTAIIISSHNVGIDIQKISSKALSISSKFITENTHQNLSKEKATIIWSCKETIYKFHKKEKINFKSDIIVRPFIVNKKGNLKCEFQGKIYNLQYIKINKHFLVYVCK